MPMKEVTALYTSSVATLVLARAVLSHARRSSGRPEPAKLDIAVKTLPSPAKLAKNTFEVTVKDASGTPLTDVGSVSAAHARHAGDVDAEMKTDVKLKADEGNCRDRAVTMAGGWNVGDGQGWQSSSRRRNRRWPQ
jgi:hypothetical protein